MNGRIGEVHQTKQGYEATIIYYLSSQKCTVRFNDENKTVVKNVRYYWLLKGAINNPNHKTIHNVGFIGQGNYRSSINGKDTKEYCVWAKMMARCYDLKQQSKQPSYLGCSVCNEWHNFQVFAEWFNKNHIEGYHLDKDILVKGNKIYSPDTCCFVPIEINSLLTKNNVNRGSLPIGVTKVKGKFVARVNIENKRVTIGRFDSLINAFNAYKKAKENHVKELASKYFNLNRINSNVYNALCNYNVEITD